MVDYVTVVKCIRRPCVGEPVQIGPGQSIIITCEVDE